MMCRTLCGVLVAGTILGTAFGFMPRESAPAAAAAPAPLAADSFGVDAVHSSIIFKIQHMGLTNFYGRFNAIEGSYTFDAEKPEASTFEFSVKTDSIDSNSQGRDRHLKSADFFNVAEYPAITFKSTGAAKTSENRLNVTGDLTMHGVTKPVTVDMHLGPVKEGQRGTKHGFEATFTVKRSDFDMSYGVAEGGLGDEVTIIVAIEGAKRS